MNLRTAVFTDKTPFSGVPLQRFWNFIEQGQLINRAIFLWTIVFFVNLLAYVVVQILLGSNYAQQYLSMNLLLYYSAAIKFYLVGIILVYIMFFILKGLGRDLSEDVVIFGILAALFNYVHLSRFFGPLFFIIAPLFLIISIANISIILGPRIGYAGLVISVILYAGELLLEWTGVLDTLPIVLPSAPFNDILTHPTLYLTLGISFAVVLALFGWLIVHAMKLLERKTQQTMWLMEEKDRFFSMVSHDLRTPMTAITGYTSILLDNSISLDEERRRKYLNVINEESERLVRLVDNLLDIKRLEEGCMELHREDINLAEVVEESVKVFWAASDEKKQKLEINLPEGGFIVRADRDRLAQAIANLLSNAVKFTPEEGRITVAMSVFSEKNKPHARVSVTDSGPGISGEDIDKLFQRYRQLGSPEGRKTRGSGLGLALVREIITLHGGRVGVESEPGKGSCFYFILPGAPTGTAATR